jgi:hypothetical protein
MPEGAHGNTELGELVKAAGATNEVGGGSDVAVGQVLKLVHAGSVLGKHLVDTNALVDCKMGEVGDALLGWLNPIM